MTIDYKFIAELERIRKLESTVNPKEFRKEYLMEPSMDNKLIVRQLNDRIEILEKEIKSIIRQIDEGDDIKLMVLKTNLLKALHDTECLIRE